jgi:hypothetical protein
MMGLQRLEATVYLGVILLSLVFHGFSAEPTAEISKDEGDAVSVLFEHFETVFHTVPALLSDTRRDSGIGFAREPFGYLLLALDSKNRKLRTTLFDDSDAVLLGTKDYVPPDGLGRVISTRCYIAVLRDGRGLDFSQYLGAPTLKNSSGHPIWTWSVDLGEFGDRITRATSLYATEVGETYFVITNSLSELHSVSDEISSATRSAILSKIRGWDSIERREFWGYRKYKDARSRPPATMFNGLAGVESEAEGLILYVDLDHHRGVLRFLSTNPSDPTAGHLHDVWRMPPVKSIGDGEWETLFPLAESDPQETAFQVWWLFGLGTAV